ncbi:alpha/beta fold hydrolase [Pseudanabaena sp. UWO310]|uniref:alpha/beta fold hydrolase n=1 Tax=Pseudanabaena sp. UWO310 TaxID=2480795 RepID=UPI0011588C04|nr:alpha/beta hydrolase [Pseudanabaena sp. UWO310]TYQ31699.1 alpha/beta hydrolase [Pseudanabaena sp. UWO310]
MPISILVILLVFTTLYQAISSYLENRRSPIGQLIDVGGYRLHLYTLGASQPTIVLDHSLGGVEGYLLIEELATIGRVCIYDRAGYGWSDHSPHPRTSEQIVQELDIMLTQAKIEPPYILIGDSFGSYNIRLYAHLFPHKVLGLIFTDGLHEIGMLNMPFQLKALKLFFLSGFVMSILGSALGIIRLLKTLRIFELIKPELQNFSEASRDRVKHSFCLPKHWITMSQEITSLDKSSEQVSVAKNVGVLPIVNIKSASFFKPTFWTRLIPLRGINKLRDKMHLELSKLSTDFLQIEASQSGHFVWVDQPDLLVTAVKMVIEKI